jgi:dihydropteroate synthase
MAKVVAKSGAPIVIMHNKDSTDYYDLMGEILRFFAKSVELALAAGVKESRIIIDPGIGFGKTTRQNIEIINRLGD